MGLYINQRTIDRMRSLVRHAAGGTVLAAMLSTVPGFAQAADRLTVKDGAGTTTFKVTDTGDITATSFSGDGSALSGVAKWRGDWSTVTAYFPNEVVTYNGSSFVAVVPNTAVVPGTDPAKWQVFAAQGPQGAEGPQGLTGLEGQQGPIGLTGPDGPQGPIGLTGATGPEGPIGLTGPQGIQGIQGDIGPIGLTGPQGIQGIQGIPGEIGPIGLTGPAGPEGPIGLTGATGPEGPIGLTGATGPQGPIGLTGPQGPAGSPDTQIQILSKISTSTDGAMLAVQQGPSETNSTAAKFALKDATGTQNIMQLTAQGRLGLGTGFNPSVVIHAKGDSLYKAQTIMHYSGTNPNGGGGYIAYHNNAEGALPVAGDRLGYFLFGASEPGSSVTRNGAGIAARAEENWSSSSIPSYFAFETAASGSSARSERMRINGTGNVGIGTTAPSQRLEVNGGIRINTTAARPTCSSTTRGTFWFTQGAGTSDDSVSVCSQIGGAFTWKVLY